jgi:hypothetical protein
MICKWIVENLDAPFKLPHISEWERKIDYASLDIYQQSGEKAEREINNSLAICAQLHKATHILTHKGNLPPVEALRKTKYDEHIFKEVQLNMN